MKKLLKTIVHFVSHPCDETTKLIIKEQTSKKHVMLTLGIIAALVGGFLASIEQTYFPKFVWDTFSYSIHGLGVAPIAKVLLNL